MLLPTLGRFGSVEIATRQVLIHLVVNPVGEDLLLPGGPHGQVPLLLALFALQLCEVRHHLPLSRPVHHGVSPILNLALVLLLLVSIYFPPAVG